MGKVGIHLLFVLVFVLGGCSGFEEWITEWSYGVVPDTGDPKNRGSVSFEVTLITGKYKEQDAYQRMKKFCDGDPIKIELVKRKTYKSSHYDEYNGETFYTYRIFKFIKFRCIRPAYRHTPLRPS